MVPFRYQARGRDGELIVGVIEASDEQQVAVQLLSQGITPVVITAQASGWSLSLRRPRRGPGLAEMALFARQLQALTRAGVPISRSLRQLRDTARNERLRAALGAITEDLESGRALASAMARHPEIFSPLFVAMVRVGEESGRLDEALRQLFKYLERERTTINQIKSALRYPTFVLLTVAIALFVLMAYVIPVFAEVFARFGMELPIMTRVIIGLSNWVASAWLGIVVAAVGAIFGMRAYIRTEPGRLAWDRWLVRLPIVGELLLRGALARFARAFSMASASGVPLLQALSVVARAVDNAWVGERVMGMRAGIERGESILRTAQQAEVFTPLVLQMISVGEETGQVDDMLSEVAEYYEQELAYDVQRMAETIQPLLVVAVGVIVFVLALGVFMPMWEMTQLAQR